MPDTENWSKDKIILKVTLEKIYIFHEDELFGAGCKSVEEIKERYFQPKALNQHHTFREKCHLGYGDRITQVKQITEEEMVKIVKSK